MTVNVILVSSSELCYVVYSLLTIFFAYLSQICFLCFFWFWGNHVLNWKVIDFYYSSFDVDALQIIHGGKWFLDLHYYIDNWYL